VRGNVVLLAAAFPCGALPRTPAGFEVTPDCTHRLSKQVDVREDRAARIDGGHVRVCSVRVSWLETWLVGAMLLLASCTSSEPFVCPTEGFDAEDGDACESEGVVCEIDAYGECLPSGISLRARASCIKGRWQVDTFGRCPDHPRGGAGGCPCYSGGSVDLRCKRPVPGPEVSM
jgi:hypothetical protein